MPLDATISHAMWARYVYMRDSGHLEFVKKAEKCNNFFIGDQWEAIDKQVLVAQKRPALTINKIMPTLSTLFGEQIKNRAEVIFRPTAGASSETAEALTKLYTNISDNNQLAWLRSEVFADGCITSRGFYDVRMDFEDNLRGDVRIKTLNPKNVIPDPDADEYDPDTWNDVMVTKWMSNDDIALLYGKEDAELLKGRETSNFPYSWDSVERNNDKFGARVMYGTNFEADTAQVLRNIRVLERQYRKMDKQKFFVDLKTGDLRVIPEDWGQDKIAVIVQKYGLGVTDRKVKRIRWTVTADDIVLHDEWSPYKHFTVLPYFPNFRRGHTVGLVENLLGPQELLNKVSSQELHVVNTSANSGWIVKTGSLVNMSIEELENRGATTGLVLEVKDDTAHIQKITPNATPSGLDRITYKAEDSIKSISNVSDSMQGFDREDVAAKAIIAKTARGSVNQAKILDNLSRTDHMLARNILDLIQEFYTEERIINVTHDRMTGEQTTLALNQESPEGEIVNDLTIGEYDIVVTTVPDFDTLEDSQFQQALSMREAGIQIPDEVLIENSRLLRRNDIVKSMNAAKESEEAKQQQQMQMAMQQAELGRIQAEAMKKGAEANKISQEVPANPMAEAQAKMEIEQQKLAMSMQKMQAEMEMKMESMRAEIEMKTQRAASDINLQEQQAGNEAMMARRKGAAELNSGIMKSAMEKAMALSKLQQNQEAHEAKLTQMKQTAAAKPKPKPTKGAK